MPSTELTITEEPAGASRAVVLHLCGTLDSYTFPMLEEAVQRQFQKGCYQLIFDLSELEYISSAGCGQFVGAMSEAQEHSGNIVLCNANEFVYNVFNLIGLIEMIPIVDSFEAALARFK
jgi:anti-sigma B factor antagonist